MRLEHVVLVIRFLTYKTKNDKDLQEDEFVHDHILRLDTNESWPPQLSVAEGPHCCTWNKSDHELMDL